MTQPRMAFDPVRVSELNEERNALAAKDLATEVRPVGPGWATCKPSDPWINRLCGVNDVLPEDELDEVVRFYRTRGVEPKVEVSSMVSEAFLVQLASRGFGIVHFENVFARPLGPDTDCWEGVPETARDGLHIEQTMPSDRQACLAHARIALSGFVSADAANFEEMAETSADAISLERSRGFVAHVHGEPAGACGMELWTVEGETLCGLWGTTVRERYRRRGMQQAMIAHRLGYAQKHGCTLAIIESKPGIATERNAARMGFLLAYTRVVLAAPIEPPRDRSVG